MTESGPREECGYVEDKINLPENYQPIRCSKTVWNGERCVWHAETEDKPIEDLRDSLGDGAERIDGAILRGLQATEARKLLSEHELPYADLQNSELRGADLIDTKLKNADLTNADLSNATIREASFDGSILTGAYLQKTRIRDTSFRNANLQRANLAKSDIAESDFTNADLTDAKFTDVTELPDVTLTRAVLPEAVLADVKFSGSELKEAVLEGATLVRADLKECDLTEADLTDADLRQAKLQNANLENARMVRSDLLGSNLAGAGLYQAYLVDAQINSDTQFNAKCTYESPEEWPEREPTKLVEAAIWQYQQITKLYRDQALTVEASKYHQKKEQAKQRYYKDDNPLKWGIQVLNGWLSDYGESPYRVIKISIGTILVLSIIYPISGFQNNGDPVSYAEVIDAAASTGTVGTISELARVVGTSVYFSTVTFTTLGYGDVIPLTTGTQALAMIEAFVGALLMAYLVFVLGKQVDW